MRFIGLDAGSVSIKLVILDEQGNIHDKYYERHKGYPLRASLQLLKKIIQAGSLHAVVDALL